MGMGCVLSSCDKSDSTSDGLDALLSMVGDLFAHDNHGGLGQFALAKHLEVAVLGHVNDGSSGGFRLGTRLLAHQRPQLVQVDHRSELLVPLQVEVSLTSLSEVTRMTKQTQIQ